MIKDALTLASDTFPGLLLLGSATFILATVYLWSTSRKPTRFAGLRYEMIQDKVPQITLAMIILIGIFLVMLIVERPNLITVIVPVALMALLLAVVVNAVITWAEGIQRHRHASRQSSSQAADDEAQERRSAPIMPSSDSHSLT